MPKPQFQEDWLSPKPYDFPYHRIYLRREAIQLEFAERWVIPHKKYKCVSMDL
jgi:hypothetical protein